MPGPIIGQIVFVTGAGFDFGGYVVKVKASTPGESQVAAHYDIYLPQLLTGVAVCPNTAGVTTTFRFPAEALFSTIATQPATGAQHPRLRVGSPPRPRVRARLPGCDIEAHDIGFVHDQLPADQRLRLRRKLTSHA